MRRVELKVLHVHITSDLGYEKVRIRSGVK